MSDMHVLTAIVLAQKDAVTRSHLRHGASAAPVRAHMRKPEPMPCHFGNMAESDADVAVIDDMIATAVSKDCVGEWPELFVALGWKP